MTNGRNRNLGESGESLAAAFLGEKNFNIIKRNFRYSKSGEIDIIAQKNSLIIFVEVKNRMSEKFGGALYSISGKKKRSLKTAAKAFLSFYPEFNQPGYTFRFDLISIVGESIDWSEDIFR
jgi:putative endonuclease